MFSTTTVGGVLAEQERIIIISFWMCINYYAFVCGVKSDDDFLRVRHEKEGQKAAKKERENKRTTEQRKERIFLRFKKRELTVGIDQTTNVFFHPQKTKENKRVLYLSALSKRDLL